MGEDWSICRGANRLFDQVACFCASQCLFLSLPWPPPLSSVPFLFLFGSVLSLCFTTCYLGHCVCAYPPPTALWVLILLCHRPTRVHLCCSIALKVHDDDGDLYWVVRSLRSVALPFICFLCSKHFVFSLSLVVIIVGCLLTSESVMTFTFFIHTAGSRGSVGTVQIGKQHKLHKYEHSIVRPTYDGCITSISIVQ